ncbi:jmjC domain-containing protein 8 isoform X2 [Sceloporus undulatus]|uniref:jmjC domain-containing protein 8 isoform X2 n=1 Tax=Sceloporus undulatus TaxID=8520 RepID=UPI001C4B0A5A|nr:jmjC domain-containing protein 8 isoform X2 [Sceloporus undulatus]
MSCRPFLLLLLLASLLLLPAERLLLEKDGGWLTSRHAALMEEETCTVERRDTSLTYAQFIQQYAFSRPVILQGITDNSEFQSQCTKERLLAKFGDHPIRLSTANTYSYRKVDLPFQEYVDQLLEPQDLNSLGSETFYFFGDNNFTEWGPLFQNYTPPPFQIPGTTGAYSFGIAGQIWLRCAISLARPRFLRGYLWQEALVSVSAREDARVPPKQNNSVLVAGYLPIPATMGEAH